MKLKDVIKKLKGEGPVLEISLLSCKDADALMETFLGSLKESPLTRLTINTDFIANMKENSRRLFLEALSDIPNLEEVVIRSFSRFHITRFPSKGLASLRQCKSLKRLVLEDMQVTATHADFISDLGLVLQDHNSIREVVMTNFFANDWSNTQENVLDPLVKRLASMPRLEVLELSGCGSYALRMQDLSLISVDALSELAGVSTLTKLQLSFLDFQDCHFEAIASQLLHNETLKTLSLDYHDLDRDGFSHIMHSVAKNSTLVNLSLRTLRDVGKEGFIDASKMLRTNFCLEHLSITVSPTYQAQLDLYLRMNRAGRGLLREPTASMNHWITVLATNSHDVDLTRHLIQEIPGLCISATQAREPENPATNFEALGSMTVA